MLHEGDQMSKLSKGQTVKITPNTYNLDDEDVVSFINGTNSESFYESDYPMVFSYSDTYSIKNNSDLDLMLSYSSNYIARGDHRAHVGDGVLVCSRRNRTKTKKQNEVSVFAAVIVSDEGETDLWKDKGGKSWRYGYRIKKVSEIVHLDEDEIKDLVGDFQWFVFSGSKVHKAIRNGKNAQRFGYARDKIFNHIVRTYPYRAYNMMTFQNKLEQVDVERPTEEQLQMPFMADLGLDVETLSTKSSEEIKEVIFEAESSLTKMFKAIRSFFNI